MMLALKADSSITKPLKFNLMRHYLRHNQRAASVCSLHHSLSLLPTGYVLSLSTMKIRVRVKMKPKILKWMKARIVRKILK